MSDATLTADIVIRFNEKMLKKFNKLIKKTETSMKAIAKVTDKVTGAEEKLNRERKKQNKTLKENNREEKKRKSQATKTAASVTFLAGKLAQLRVIMGLVQFAASTVFKTLAIPAGVVAGWTGFLIAMSRGEKDINRMAKSVQVGTGFLKAFSMATKEAGLSADNAVDMLEEMSNKVGDGLETPTHGTTKAFDELGLSLEEVQKMSRQKGLTKIMDSIVEFRRRTGDDQKAVRFADEIFGGEGNKFTGFLLESGELFSDLINKNKEYNLVSNETSKIWADLGTSSERTGGMFSGLLKEGFKDSAKDLEGLMRGLQVFMRDNKDELVETISNIGDAFTTITANILEFGTKNKDKILFGLDVTLETLKNMATLALEVAGTVLKITDALQGEDVGQGHSTEAHKAARNIRTKRRNDATRSSGIVDSIAELFGVDSPSTSGSPSSRKRLTGTTPKTPQGDVSITVVSPDPLQAGELIHQTMIDLAENN